MSQICFDFIAGACMHAEDGVKAGEGYSTKTKAGM